ncbi:MAG: universal stress protein [Actinomycetota bacterium]
MISTPMSDSERATTAMPAKPDVAEMTDAAGAHTWGAVVGVDGSPGSAHALRWAARRTGQFGPVRPVLTWQYPYWAVPGMDPVTPAALFDRCLEAARREAGVAVADIAPDLRAATEVIYGAAGPTLVERSADANALVVGSRNHGAAIDTMIGSVGGHVARHARVPVIVVPERAHLDNIHGRIVVGVDGSPNAVEALSWALTHAPAGAAVEAVYVWSCAVPFVGPSYVIPIESSADDARASLDRTIAAARIAAGTDREVTTILDYGDDPRTLLRTRSLDADLLVLGARGRTGVQHLLLGSVTTSLLHQPTVATVVVPGDRAGA